MERTFACPRDKTQLDKELKCPHCKTSFPLVDGIPVLINDSNSVFRVSDYVSGNGYGGASTYAGSLDGRSGMRQIYRRVMHRISEASPPKRDFHLKDALDKILQSCPHAEILVIGSGDTTLRGNITYTDVAFGRNVTCIADAHDLPFLAESFDACIAVAVLEHVVDPYRCVQEIVRVLRPGGFVYAETPFLQPVHMGAYDFTRFTHLGHRRLFRNFEAICSGVAGGPGISAGQSLRYALVALSDKPLIKKWLKLVGLLGAYPFRWLDYITFGNQSAFDSASGFYFFGRLAQVAISDRDLIALFRGG